MNRKEAEEWLGCDFINTWYPSESDICDFMLEVSLMTDEELEGEIEDRIGK